VTENSLPRLPENWAWTTIGQLYDIVGGGTPATCVPEYWNGDIPWITSADITGLKEITPRKYVTKSGVQNSATHVVPEKSLIVVTRVGLGKVGLTNVSMCFSQDSQALIGNGSLIYPEYSLYYLSKAVQIFKYQHRGTTISGVTKKQLSELIFPLPPFNEQRRIANKIEELFSDLGAGVESLEKIKKQLKRYRQAVLKYAFEGKLSQKWRENHKALNTSTQISSLSELPEGWVHGKLQDLIFIAGRIGWRGLKAEEYTKEGPLFLSVYNLNKGEVVDLSDSYHVTEERYEESPEIQLRNDDILLVKDGAGIGKVGIVQGLNTKATVNSSLLVIRSGKVFRPKFLFHFLRGPKMQEVVRKRITGSTTPHLFQRDIKKFELLIPPLSEQDAIIEEIEAHFSVIDETEGVVNQSLIKAETLRQSILKRAFAGRLVPQDPDDEPAEKLLEHIEFESAKQKTKSLGDIDRKKPKANNNKQLELSRYVK